MPCAQHGAGTVGNVHGDFYIVHLGHGDLGRGKAALIFQAAKLQSQELPLGKFGDHMGQLSLLQLKSGNGSVKLDTALGILKHRLVTVVGGTQ